jgi:hypothetical protein
MFCIWIRILNRRLLDVGLAFGISEAKGRKKKSPHSTASNIFYSSLLLSTVFSILAHSFSIHSLQPIPSSPHFKMRTSTSIAILLASIATAREIPTNVKSFYDSHIVNTLINTTQRISLINHRTATAPTPFPSATTPAKANPTPFTARTMLAVLSTSRTLLTATRTSTSTVTG